MVSNGFLCLGLDLSVAALLVNVSVALALLAILEKTGDAEDKDSVDACGWMED